MGPDDRVLTWAGMRLPGTTHISGARKKAPKGKHEPIRVRRLPEVRWDIATALRRFAVEMAVQRKNAKRKCLRRVLRFRISAGPCYRQIVQAAGVGAGGTAATAASSLFACATVLLVFAASACVSAASCISVAPGLPMCETAASTEAVSCTRAEVLSVTPCVIASRAVISFWFCDSMCFSIVKIVCASRESTSTTSSSNTICNAIRFAD